MRGKTERMTDLLTQHIQTGKPINNIHKTEIRLLLILLSNKINTFVYKAHNFSVSQIYSQYNDFILNFESIKRLYLIESFYKL